jgi:hypothetical protein
MVRLIYVIDSKSAVTLVEDENSNIALSDVCGIIEANTMEMCRTLLKRSKGNDILNRFLSENEQVEITTEQNLIQLQHLAVVKELLLTGAITSARDIAYTIPPEAFILTPPYATQEERKSSYIEEMNSFINSLTNIE